MDPEDELHSFPFTEIINGIEYNYRITETGGRFGVERDGIVIAEISHNDRWKQVSGNQLDEKLIGKIGDYIESHYD